MDQFIVIGLVAGLITTMGYVPQVIKGYRSGRMEDVSILMPLVLIVGMSLWLIYGIILGDIPIILWNAVSVILNSGMVVLKIRYERRRRKAVPPAAG
ncbi:MAG: SemiSWEET transporter [Candidatus Methanomethylophilaceae archaeon]|nr:SemiSWEET transporter [Candidatus Methanomethylophilaceae archaeon]